MSAKRYCFTINNWKEEDIDAIISFGLSEICSYMVFGFETGESNTPHIQGFVILTSSRRLTYMKNNLNQRAHFETTRGTSQEAADYCKKDGQFEEFGDIKIHTGGAEKQKQDFQETIELAKKGLFEQINPTHYLRYNAAIHNIHQRHLSTSSRSNIPCPDIQLFPWQQVLFDYLNGPISPREIIFVHDPVGNGGKSTFCKYLTCKIPGSIVLRPGKNADMAFQVCNCPLQELKVVLLDCPRSRTHTMAWDFLECLKDGHLSSPKYESSIRYIEVPHVVVMCNDLPWEGTYSADRVTILDLEGTFHYSANLPASFVNAREVM